MFSICLTAVIITINDDDYYDCENGNDDNDDKYVIFLLVKLKKKRKHKYSNLEEWLTITQSIPYWFSFNYLVDVNYICISRRVKLELFA